MRPSWVEVDLGAIRRNVRAIAELVTPAALCAVVKADAYGHGDVPVAEAALDAGAEMLAVALVEEGARLREAGITAPILLLSEPPPADAADIVRWDLVPTVYTRAFADALEQVADRPVPVHLKVDTGMHRVGADPDRLLEVATAVARAPHLRPTGLWTHLAVAEEDPGFTEEQLRRFEDAAALLRDAGIEIETRHVANTAGALGYPEARLDLVRVGLGIYGLYPAPHLRTVVDLEPAMSVRSEVVFVRDLPAGARPSYGRRRPLPRSGRVATVPIGYADGVPRLLGARGGEVLVGGRRRPIAGTVTMDQIVVEVDETIEPGEPVVLLGRQGGEAIGADEWADRTDTIAYEIVCGIGPRLPRRYR